MLRLAVKRIFLALVVVASLASIVLFVPWSFLRTVMAPLPDTVSQQVKDASEHGLDGVVVYIDEKGHPPVTLTEGWHNKALQQPANADALFKIASISKLYLAVVTVKLANRQQLSLDSTLADYLPEIAKHIEHADKITLRMLLQHRSGIPNYTDDSHFNWFSPPDSSDALLALIADQKSDFLPGTQYRYSNTNFVLLAKVIDEGLRLDHRQLIREMILDPLHLQDTFFSSKTVYQARLMSGYIRGLDVDVKPIHFVGASSEIVATASDVARFIRALNDGSLLTESEQRIYGTVYEFGHTGLLPGYSSIARYYSDIDTVIVQFANTSGEDSWGVTEANYERMLAILRKMKSTNSQQRHVESGA